MKNDVFLKGKLTVLITPKGAYNLAKVFLLGMWLIVLRNKNKPIHYI